MYSALGKPLVVLVTTDRIRVTFHRDRSVPDRLSVEDVGDVAHFGARVARQARFAELEQHVGKIDDDAAIGLAGLEVLSLELLDELAIARELALARVKLLVGGLQLVADHCATDSAEGTADGGAGGRIARCMPNQRTDACTERRAPQCSSLTFRWSTGAGRQPQYTRGQRPGHTSHPSHGSPSLSPPERTNADQ